MNSIRISLLLAGVLAASCSNDPQPTTNATTTQVPAVAENSLPSEVESAMPHGAGSVLGDSLLGGNVLETMDSGGYTYVLVDKGDEQIWAAGPQRQIAVGDAVTVMDPMPMPGFHSSTLERDFELIYFASELSTAAPGEMDIAASHGTSPAGAEVEVSEIERVDNGQIVEELFLQRSELAGTEILVRGKVVKFSADIMGKNWLHLQDGSGSKGTNDLTVTTSGTFAVGDFVVVRGVLVADRDFGYGYKYDLVVEDAQVTKE